VLFKPLRVMNALVWVVGVAAAKLTAAPPPPSAMFWLK
jgi:hypothetical protein